MKTRLMLVEDHGLVREGLRALLNAQDDMTVVGEAADGREAVRMVKRVKPDVVVMDTNLPRLNGVEATRQITADASVKVLALADASTNRAVGEMFQAGASGLLLKSASFDELLQAIKRIASGETYLGGAVAEIVVQHYIRGNGHNHGEGNGQTNGHTALTPREREVLQLLAEGHAPREVAGLLAISIKTVDTHRHQIMKKCRFRGLADLTRYALREGLTTLHVEPQA
ncbi:response regulator [Phycisphaerales bacterium AB-hyl4]|uniref:Response regulator n=1 Tax=Natronomicrosphaera hydrolytica TaxID=3242702 RepID=A0ABV4U5Y2_9BACT